MPTLTLHEVYNEYKRILDAINKSEISDVHGQGALAFLELKAKDVGIVFIAPELHREDKNFIQIEHANHHITNLVEYSDSSDDFVSSETQDDSEAITEEPTPTETTGGESEEESTSE